MFVFDEIAKFKSNVSCCQLIWADVSWFFWHAKLLIDINVHSSAFVSTILSTNWILEKKLSFWKFWKFWEVSIFKSSNFWLEIQIQGLNWVENMPHMFVFDQIAKVKSNVSCCQLISADVSWFFWHGKLRIDINVRSSALFPQFYQPTES